MGLNKSKGNMYPFVDYTYNVIKGKCPHDCSYCYMKRFPQKELRFDEKELKTDLGSGNIIFVGSSCDMWAADIDVDWIERILSHCKNYHNEYLFQSKNPIRFYDFRLPIGSIIGTTIESNRWYPNIMGDAPSPGARVGGMKAKSISSMVSIEPIMDFDLDDLVSYIKSIKPIFVSVGADSGNNHLPEPEPDKVMALIEALKEITEVKTKNNLSRLLQNSRATVS